MNELQALINQRNELLTKIREIEASCEGIENENNAQRVQELNLEQAKLTAQKNDVQSRLNEIKGKLDAINSEISDLSGTGVDRILEAIKKQRWYFFKNKTKVLMDRNTGLLWPNILYYNVFSNDTGTYHPYNEKYTCVLENDFDGIGKWDMPTQEELKTLLDDYTFPYCKYSNKGESHEIITPNGYVAQRLRVTNYENTCIMLYKYEGSFYRIQAQTGHTETSCWYPRSNVCVEDTNYERDISIDNPVYTEKERLKFTLDLFVDNGLMPIFDDEEITQLYKKIYFEKPKLLEELQKIQVQIEDSQTVTLLSSEFDYTALLSKYDVKAIDESVIKYYEAIQQWTDELMERLYSYEKEMELVIGDFNLVSLKLSNKYEDNPNLNDEENDLLSKRQHYFQKKFSLGMHSIKSKIIAVKEQADALEYRIDEIDNGEDAIHQLALLENEERASFSFIAENTAKIIKNALLKIEYFQDNHSFVMNAIEIWEKWSENYRVFKTTYREDLKAACDDDSVEEEVWTKWYESWQKIRFIIEQKVQPVIERALKGAMPNLNGTEVSIPEQLISILEQYKNNIDVFFREDRKGIYQKFVFQAGGELQDKFETEGELYKCTAAFQNSLQEIVFNCAKEEDRAFIMKWANDLMDIQIDEILNFIANNDLQKIDQTTIKEFAALKQKNYDAYLADAKSYSEEKSRREKEFNSLIFKMRKDLMKIKENNIPEA